MLRGSFRKTALNTSNGVKMADVSVLHRISGHVLGTNSKSLPVEVFLLDVDKEGDNIRKLLDKVEHNRNAQVDTFNNQR